MSARTLTVVALVLVVFSVPVVADEMTMKVSDNCGFEWKDLMVRIWNPPDGNAKVTDDGTVTVDVPEGTKLRVFVAPSACPKFCADQASCVDTCRKTCPEGDDACLKRCDSSDMGCSEGCLRGCTVMTNTKLHAEWTAATDGGTLKVECRN